METTPLSATVCVNCGQQITTKYCPNCGQPSPPKKLGFSTMWYDFQSRIIGFDGMFPRTLKDLTIRPGKAAKNYIYGNRMMYYGPVGYFFLMITLWLLVASFLNIDMKDLLNQSSALAAKPVAGSEQERLNGMMFKLMTENWKIFSFMIIPVMGLMAKVFFRKAPYNFIEHTVLPLYTTGHSYWISAIGLFFVKFSENSTVFFLGSLIIVPYYIFACVGFYDYQSKVKVIVKSFFIYILSLFLYSLIFVIIIMVYILTNPQLIDQLKKSTP